MYTYIQIQNWKIKTES